MLLWLTGGFVELLRVVKYSNYSERDFLIKLMKSFIKMKILIQFLLIAEPCLRRKGRVHSVWYTVSFAYVIDPR